MQDKKTFVVRIEKSMTYTFLVDAESEEAAEKAVDKLAEEGKLDSMEPSEGLHFDRAYAVYEIDAHIKD